MVMSEILLGAGPFLGAIMLPLLAGMATLVLITGNQRFSAGLALSLGYALGLGILGQLMLVVGWLDLPVNKDTVTLAIFIYISVITLALLLRLHFFPSKSIDFSKNNEGARGLIGAVLFALMLVFVLYQMVYIFWNAFYVPINQMDAFSVYAYKAKMFFYTHNLKPPLELYLSGKYLSYPLQIPLDITWVALNINGWHEGWAQMIFPFNCLAFIIIVYNFMKFWTDRLTAIFTTALILSSLFFVLHASIAYCDFTVMSYTVLSFLLMAWGIYHRSLSFIILSGLMAAFAASVKLEGMGYFLLGTIVLGRFIFSGKPFDLKFALKALAGFVLPFIIVEVNFFIFKAHCGIASLLNKERQFVQAHDYHAIVASKSGLLAHILTIVKALEDNFFLSGNWNVLWFILIVMIFANWRHKKSFAIDFFSFSLGLFFLYYAAIALFTKMFIYLTTPNSINFLSRLVLHFLPVLLRVDRLIGL